MSRATNQMHKPFTEVLTNWIEYKMFVYTFVFAPIFNPFKTLETILENHLPISFGISFTYVPVTF